VTNAINIFSIVFLQTLLQSVNPHAGLKLIEWNYKTGETNLAAVLLPNDQSVDIAICNDEKNIFDGRCREFGLVGSLTLGNYSAAISESLNLSHYDRLTQEITEQEQKIKNYRTLINQQSDDEEIDDKEREKKEERLFAMVEEVDKVYEKRAPDEPRARLHQKILQSVRERGTQPAVSGVDEPLFEVAITPFRPWLESHVCQCRRVQSADGVRYCDLALDGTTLAKKSGKDCDSRKACLTGDWVAEKEFANILGQKPTLQNAVDKSCHGFFGVWLSASEINPPVKSLESKTKSLRKEGEIPPKT
jgi:hypothetical protein